MTASHSDHDHNHPEYEAQACDHDHHGHDHAHSHHHAHHHHTEISSRHFKVLQWVFGLTCIYLGVEIVGGLASGSLALLADGFHMFADAAAIGISLFAAWLSHRPAPAQRTFGYQRVEILAAFFNALLLIAMSGFILYESYERFYHPEPIQASLMLIIAIGGLFINIAAAWLLHRDHQHNMNIKGAYLHVLGDLLGSVGAIVAGLLILWLDWRWADPLMSCLVAGLIVYSAVGLLWEAINVLLEGCPTHINIEEIRAKLLGMDGIEAIHHLHVWNINLNRSVLTAHLVVIPSAYNGETLNRVQQMLQEHFNLGHVTLQLEIQE